jgi:hypothetical protein
MPVLHIQPAMRLLLPQCRHYVLYSQLKSGVKAQPKSVHIELTVTPTFAFRADVFGPLYAIERIACLAALTARLRLFFYCSSIVFSGNHHIVNNVVPTCLHRSPKTWDN